MVKKQYRIHFRYILIILIIQYVIGLPYSYGMNVSAKQSNQKKLNTSYPTSHSNKIERLKTEYGYVSGKYADTKRRVAFFKGIPYASPPIGPLRWRSPEPPNPWDNVRQAHHFSPMCPQKPNAIWPSSPPDMEMNEDCLYLNIFTPSLSIRSHLPVMVYLHGGGFARGTGAAYDGIRFAEAGVVLVTLNYRLNLFAGFAHSWLNKESAKNASGNYGMMDQIAALKWVKHNIGEFGGNPNNVTLFGHSAGGRYVTAHMASPHSKGLFHRAIIESSTLLPNDFFLETGRLMIKKKFIDNPKTNPFIKILAKMIPSQIMYRILPLNEIQGYLLVKKLKAKNIEELRSMKWEDFPKPYNFNAYPMIDGWILPKDPVAVFSSGKQHDVPLLIGLSKEEEGGYLHKFKQGLRTVKGYQAFVKKMFREDAARLLSAYPVDSDKQVYEVSNQLTTDLFKLMAIRQRLREMEKVSSKAFLYYLDYLPPSDKARLLGVHHGAINELLFSLKKSVYHGNNLNPSKGDWDMSDTLLLYWTQFAKAGDPNKEGLPYWPAYESDSGHYLELGTKIKAKAHLHQKQLEIIENIQQLTTGEAEAYCRQNGY